MTAQKEVFESKVGIKMFCTRRGVDPGRLADNENKTSFLQTSSNIIKSFQIESNSIANGPPGWSIDRLQ